MEFGEPKKLPDGRYFLKVTNGTHQLNGLVLQGALDTKSVNFAIPEGTDLFTKIDTEIVEKAKQSSVAWFGKELSSETITNSYQESVTDVSLGASLATVKGEITTGVFDSQRNALELSTVKDGTKCDIIMELSGLWFLKKSFGPVWRVLQVRVRGAAAKPVSKEYMFNDEPEDDEDPADFLD